MSFYTIADLELIDRAILRGELRVRHGDRDVTYRSLDEMERIRARIAGQLGQQRPRAIKPVYHKL